MKRACRRSSLGGAGTCVRLHDSPARFGIRAQLSKRATFAHSLDRNQVTNHSAHAGQDRSFLTWKDRDLRGSRLMHNSLHCAASCGTVPHVRNASRQVPPKPPVLRS